MPASSAGDPTARLPSPHATACAVVPSRSDERSSRLRTGPRPSSRASASRERSRVHALQSKGSRRAVICWRSAGGEDDRCGAAVGDHPAKVDAVVDGVGRQSSDEASAAGAPFPSAVMAKGTGQPRPRTNGIGGGRGGCGCRAHRMRRHRQCRRAHAGTRHEARSWTRDRLAVVLEAIPSGLDVRFVPTDLAFGAPRWLCATCTARGGKAENLIDLHRPLLAS